MALVLLAMAEVVLLRRLGVECLPRSSPRYVSVGEFCVSDDGRWAVAQMGFRCALARERIIDDVVTCDLLAGTTRRLCLDQFQPRCVAISPTAESLAIACADRSIYVWSGPVSSLPRGGPPTKNLRLLHRARDEGITRLIFSPDGRQLAAVGSRSVLVLRYPEGGLLNRLAWAGTTSLAFAEDSRRLILVGRDGALCWWDTSRALQVGTKALAACQVDGAVVSADGGLVAYLFSDGRIAVRNLEADTELWQHSVPNFHNNASQAIDFSPSGSLLAHVCWTCEQYQFRCYDTLTGQCLGQSPRYDATFKGMAVTSNSVVHSWDTKGVIRAWKVGPDRAVVAFLLSVVRPVASRWMAWPPPVADSRLARTCLTQHTRSCTGGAWCVGACTSAAARIATPAFAHGSGHLAGQG